MPSDAVWDIVLDDLGYILARREQMGGGGRAWSVETVGASIAQQTPTEQRYGNQAPTVDIPMVWRTAHLGYGDEQQRVEGRYRYAVNVDARFPEQILPGPLVTTLQTNCGSNVVAFFEHGGELFCVGGRYCKQIALANDDISTEKDFGEGKTATGAAVYDDVAYVGMGYSEAFWQRSTIPAWNQASGLYMGKLVVFQDSAWASVSQYEVSKFATTPAIAWNWSYEYEIGDPGRAITSLAELGNLLYVGKRDGLYVLDMTGLGQRLTPELGAYAHADNCMNMRAWHGSLWVPHIRGLLNYRHLGTQGFLVTPATPGGPVDEDNPVSGQVTAMAGDNRWLYVALYTPDGDTYIVAGREATEGERAFVDGPLIWHPLAKIASVKCEAMHISGLYTNPRLYFGLGDDVGYIVLPRGGDNPINDANCKYNLTGSIYFPSHSWASPTTTKLWKAIEIQGDKLSSARYVKVYYKVDDGPWLLAGTATFSTSHVLPLAQEGVAGKKIELRLDYTIPNTGAPFLIRAVVLRGAERPQTVALITAMVRCADGLPTRRGGYKCTRLGSEILAELKALSIAGEAVLLKDTIGYERWVIVQPGIGEQEVEQEGGLNPEKLAVVRMAEFEVEAQTVSASAYWIWDSSTWDAGDVWH